MISIGPRRADISALYVGGRERPRDTAWAVWLKPDETGRRDNFPPSRSGGLDVDGAPDGHLPEPKEVNLVEPDAAM